MTADICTSIGLRHYPDDRPGITRRRRGRGFSYTSPDGTAIDDSDERARLDAMAVPPAYTQVWMSPLANGHLMASGRDAATRKQYRYHPDWSAFHQARKFARLGELGAGLPRLRRWIGARLSEDGDTEDAAIALALALIDRMSLRVGDPAYTRQNGSYAATTLRPRHVREKDGGLWLCFSAKGGHAVEKRVVGRLLENRLRAAAARGGRRLISYADARGTRQGLRAARLSERLNDLVDAEVTPKSLRTWNGSHAAFRAARDGGADNLKALAEAASERLHNTPAIARSSYIHPDLIEAVREGRPLPADATNAADGLRAGEDGLVRFLSRG